MPNASESNPSATAHEQPVKTIGNRVDEMISYPERHPLASIGIGIVLGYVLARLLDR